jgi:hypothetical protein
MNEEMIDYYLALEEECAEVLQYLRRDMLRGLAEIADCPPHTVEWLGPRGVGMSGFYLASTAVSVMIRTAIKHELPPDELERLAKLAMAWFDAVMHLFGPDDIPPAFRRAFPEGDNDGGGAR